MVVLASHHSGSKAHLTPGPLLHPTGNREDGPAGATNHLTRRALTAPGRTVTVIPSHAVRFETPRPEALTYPFIKDIAARLGVTLVPLAMDEHGVRPDAIEKAHREAHLSALYLQPTIQNPLGMTTPQPRRTELLRIVEKLGLVVIEDTVYGFLDEETSMAAMAPDLCITLDSLSKKVAPGLALGFIVAPPRLRERVMAAVRSGGWTASGFAFAAGQRLMADGTVAELSRLKRIDAARRQQMAAKYLAGFEVQANAKSYHLWLTLPPHWRSQTFVAAAARHRADAVDHVCGHSRPCAECGAAGARRAQQRTARPGAADPVGDADGEGGSGYDGVDWGSG